MVKKSAQSRSCGTVPGLFAGLFLVPLCLALMSWSQARADDLEVLMETLPPFNYVDDGERKGFTVDIVNEILKRADIRPEGGRIKHLPWKRAYLRAQGDKPVLLLTTTRTEERENLFKWVGPLYRREQWIYRLAGNEDVSVSKLEDLRGYLIAVATESANHQLLLEGGYVDPEDIYSTSSVDSKIKMLLHRRVDAAPFLPLEVSHALKQQEIPVDAFEKVILLSGKYTYYLALSLATPDGTVAKLQRALDSMREDGTYQVILNQHLAGIG